MKYVSSVLNKAQLAELFIRANEMIEGDRLTGEHPEATTLDYLNWANEEVLANA